MAERGYEDRSILVLGGSSGIGLKIAAEGARLGATILIGTRNINNYEKARQQLLKREKLDPDTLSVFPFIADVCDKNQLAHAVREVKTMGIVVTDVVFSQASGMDGFTGELFRRHLDPISELTYATPIDELERDKKDIVDERLAAMREDLAVWTKEALPQAVAVNYQGTFDAIEVLKDEFPGQVGMAFLNSTWGYLSGKEGIEIPLVYTPVDRSKALVRDRLLRNGVSIAMIVASLVNDTSVGKLFNDFLLNLMDKEQRQAVRESSIMRIDVAKATLDVLDTDFGNESRPNNVFVYRKGGVVVVEDHLELSPMYTAPYRF